LPSLGNKPDDAVLGGQHVAPAGAVVLGGIEGVKMRLASDKLEDKKAGVLGVSSRKRNNCALKTGMSE